MKKLFDFIAKVLRIILLDIDLPEHFVMFGISGFSLIFIVIYVFLFNIPLRCEHGLLYSSMFFSFVFHLIVFYLIDNPFSTVVILPFRYFLEIFAVSSVSALVTFIQVRLLHIPHRCEVGLLFGNIIYYAFWFWFIIDIKNEKNKNKNEKKFL